MCYCLKGLRVGVEGMSYRVERSKAETLDIWTPSSCLIWLATWSTALLPDSLFLLLLPSSVLRLGEEGEKEN